MHRPINDGLDIVGPDDPRFDELRRLEEADCAETARLFAGLDHDGLYRAYNPDASDEEVAAYLESHPDGPLNLLTDEPYELSESLEEQERILAAMEGEPDPVVADSDSSDEAAAATVIGDLVNRGAFNSPENLLLECGFSGSMSSPPSSVGLDTSTEADGVAVHVRAPTLLNWLLLVLCDDGIVLVPADFRTPEGTLRTRHWGAEFTPTAISLGESVSGTLCAFIWPTDGAPPASALGSLRALLEYLSAEASNVMLVQESVTRAT